MRFCLGDFGVALRHQLLNRDRAFDGRDDGGKLQQQPVARRANDAPAFLDDQRPRGVAMLAHRLRRPRLVLAHQARVADDVDGEDRGEAAGCGHCRGPRPCACLREWARRWARYIGLSLIAVQAAREREIVKAGLSASPALTAGRASSNRPSCASAAANKKCAMRIISVGLDGPTKPRDCLLVNAEVELRDARVGHPDIGHRVAWTRRRASTI